MLRDIAGIGSSPQFDKEMANRWLDAIGYTVMLVDLELSAMASIH
jgi:hypothetical protein